MKNIIKIFKKYGDAYVDYLTRDISSMFTTKINKITLNFLLVLANIFFIGIIVSWVYTIIESFKKDFIDGLAVSLGIFIFIVLFLLLPYKYKIKKEQKIQENIKKERLEWENKVADILKGRINPDDFWKYDIRIFKIDEQEYYDIKDSFLDELGVICILRNNFKDEDIFCYKDKWYYSISSNPYNTYYELIIVLEKQSYRRSVYALGKFNISFEQYEKIKELYNEYNPNRKRA